MVFSVFRLNKSDHILPEPRRRLFRASSPTSPILSTFQAAISSKNTATLAGPDLKDLNNSLAALAAVFPDVRPDVFREMLETFSGESRLYVVAEQLLKHKARWVKDRWRIPLKGSGSNILRQVYEVEKPPSDQDDGSASLLPVEERFRSESYKQAVRSMLRQEFSNLSKSTIDGVLAEQNHSYTSTRPILLGLAAKTWRISFSTFLLRWKKPDQTVSDNHFMLLWTGPQDGNSSNGPLMRDSGDPELNAEIYTNVLLPVRERRKDQLEVKDLEVATALNEEEAEQADALHECECCFSSTTFEQMATCTTGTHTICFNCIRNAASEALYGQSWGLNIDHTRGQIACLAPVNSTPCTGCIPHSLSQRAILNARGGEKNWQKLESRLADEALLKSQAPLIQCPFCPYAELDELYLPPSTNHYRLNTAHPFRTIILLILPWNFIPLLFCYTFLAIIFSLPRPTALLSNAFKSLSRQTHLSPRFKCRSPTCLRTSCLNCKKSWRDPHVCHESATLSLRTTIEAARTTALKRTCPRCGLGFVKDSGCNKMVCVCGYAMCYVCRQGLGKGTNLPNHDGAPNLRNAGEEGEGYRHFCQHFRPAGGKCRECDRCDLYRGEDEDEVVRRAGERAEKEWRAREGWGDKGIGERASAGLAAKGVIGKWGLQDAVDWWVSMVLRC